MDIVEDNLMKEAVKSVATLYTYDEKNKTKSVKSQPEVSETWAEGVKDKNYEKLIADLNLETINESNLQTLLKRTVSEIKNTKYKRLKQTAAFDVINVKKDTQTRDPRCKERIMSYLANNSIFSSNNQNPDATEACEITLEHDKSTCKMPLSQNKLTSDLNFKKNQPPSEMLLQQNKKSSEILLQQNKETSEILLEQNIQYSEPNKKSSKEYLNQNKNLTRSPLDQNKKSPNSPLMQCSLKNSHEVVRHTNKLNKNVQEETAARNICESDKTTSTQSEMCSISTSTNKVNMLNSTKHDFNKFRGNIVHKYNQRFYRRPQDISRTPWGYRQPFHSNRNNCRLFNHNKRSIYKPKDVKHEVDSMLNLLGNTSSNSSSSVDTETRNTKTCFSLRKKNKDNKIKSKTEFKGESNIILNHNQGNKKLQISEDSNSEAISNIISQLNTFHSPTVHANQEQAFSEHKISLPYQETVTNTQTKDILIILNEDKKKIITLNNSESYSVLSKKLISSLLNDRYYKDLIHSDTLMNYQNYSIKFNEWIDIDDMESFNLADGTRLKVVFHNFQVKRKNEITNHKKVKKRKVRNNSEGSSKNTQNDDLLSEEIDQSSSVHSENILPEETNDFEGENTRVGSIENVKDKLFEVQRNDKLQTPTIQSDFIEDKTCSSDYYRNDFYELKTFLECIAQEKNNLKNKSKSEQKSVEVPDKSSTKKIKEKLKMAIPQVLKEHLIQHFKIKTSHPVQQLEMVTKKMLWAKPEYVLLKEIKNYDNSKSFLYSVIINGSQVVGKEYGSNMKSAKKLAAQNILKKFGFFKKCSK